MYLDGQRYLCAIPVVAQTSKNESAEAFARAEEEKELERATDRGWELLQAMEGHCLYYVSGWWSYQFCYNGKIRQFHQVPPQKGIPFYPPTEDPTTPSFILGQAAADEDQDEAAQGEVSNGRMGLDSTGLQEKGEMRYLVQKLGAGTICDLTGKERRVEVQVWLCSRAWSSELTPGAVSLPSPDVRPDRMDQRDHDLRISDGGVHTATLRRRRLPAAS